MRRRELLAKDTTAGSVDLGLSVKWAEGNIVKNGTEYSIGAPTDNGCYFSWGNVEGHNKDDGYDFSQAVYRSTPGSELTADISAASGYDAARVTIGGNWRLPTDAEFRELIKNCTCTWTIQDGVVGTRFTGKKSGYTNNSIFIPASSIYKSTSSSYDGNYGYCWSSTRGAGILAWYLCFNSSNQSIANDARYYGCTVRAVQ